MKINYPLLVLAIDVFGIGATEFLPMSLLPVIARGADVSILAAGMLTGAYAVGVMMGAPLMTLLLSHRAHRSTLIFLMTAFTLGNVLPAITPDYVTLMLPCILTNLSHGASFDSGSVAAASVVPKHKQASAATTIFTGLTLANIGSVPAATWLDETIGWRMPFLATVGLGVISMVSLFFSLPKGGVGARPEMKKKLTVLVRPQVLSVLLTTVLGVGVTFTLYTYISPVPQSVTHAIPVFVTAILVLTGVGFSIGNYLGGKLADRSANGMLKGLLSLLTAIMLVIPFLARNEFGVAISTVVWGAVTFAVVPPLQTRVMRVVSETPDLPSSADIDAFNLGNAPGAAAGCVVISAGLGYNPAPVMEVIVTGLALLLVFMSVRRQPEIVCVANS